MTTPASSIDENLTIIKEIDPGRTYQLTENGIQGFVDELSALKQAIYKVLNTERFEYPIYSFSYGIELDSLMGKNMDYVKVELKRRIQECLLQDNRIESVGNFEFKVNADEISCDFDVISIYGKLTISKEVNI